MTGGLVDKFTLGGVNLAYAQKQYANLVSGRSYGIRYPRSDHYLTFQKGRRRKKLYIASHHTHKTRPPIQKSTPSRIQARHQRHKTMPPVSGHESRELSGKTAQAPN